MDPSLSILRLMRRLQQKNRFVGLVKHTGLTPAETHFIIELQANPAHTIGSLSELLRIDQSFSSRIAKKLSAQKLIQISAELPDARRKGLSITQQGRQLIIQIDRFADQLIATFSENISKLDRKILIQMFRDIADSYGHPRGIPRLGEDDYRVEQRRLTRSFGLLSDNVYESGLSASHWHTLAEIAIAPTPPQPSELASLISIAQNSLSPIIASLEVANLIHRQVVPEDKRASYLRATKGGSKLFNQIEAQSQSRLRAALSNYTRSEQTKLSRIFTQFVGEGSPCLPPLLPQYRVSSIKSAKERQYARGFSARSLVAQGFEEFIPEDFLKEKAHLFFIHENDTIVACMQGSDTPKHSKKINFAAWLPSVSSWTLLGMANHVIHLSITQKTHSFDLSPKPTIADIVDFEPLISHCTI